jgi:hypothetical protein
VGEPVESTNETNKRARVINKFVMRKPGFPVIEMVVITGMLLLAILSGCVSAPTPAPPPTPEINDDLPLTEHETATLNSLEQVDDYPLYTLHYQGDYDFPTFSDTGASMVEDFAGKGTSSKVSTTWGCSLFAALGDLQQRLYGRNFDWNYSPALLLFTDPPDGYASVAMVDMEYLGFEAELLLRLADLPVEERQPLLYAPALPFDGMNETGLVVGMAAVPPGDMQPDPEKKTVGELGVIRLILDHAASVDETVEILGSYNIDMGEVPIHYLVASANEEAALVEFYQGEMRVFRSDVPWQLATNFLVAGTNGQPQGQCLRYDHISQRLEAVGGSLAVDEAMELLSEVAQDGGVSQASTQWSVVYDLSTLEIHIVMGQEYAEKAYILKLNGK